jgi:hypothetical protein
MIRATRKPDRTGAYHHGIPNRDLTESEYRAFSNEQRALIRSCGLWEVATDREMADRLKTESAEPETDSPPVEEEDDGTEVQ